MEEPPSRGACRPKRPGPRSGARRVVAGACLAPSAGSTGTSKALWCGGGPPSLRPWTEDRAELRGVLRFGRSRWSTGSEPVRSQGAIAGEDSPERAPPFGRSSPGAGSPDPRRPAARPVRHAGCSVGRVVVPPFVQLHVARRYHPERAPRRLGRCRCSLLTDERSSFPFPCRPPSHRVISWRTGGLTPLR